MKRTSAFIMSLLLICLCACAGKGRPESKPEEQPRQEQTQQGSQSPGNDALETLIFFKDIQFYQQYEGERLLCRVEFPVLTMDEQQAGLYGVSASVDSLNARLASQAREEFNRLLNSARADIELNVENSGEYYSRTDAMLLRADSRALSVLLRTESCAGAALGTVSYSCANFDTVTGRELDIANVAADSTALSQAVMEQLKNDYPKLGFYGLEDSMEQYAQDSSRYVWSLGYEGLSFYFAPYELADAEAGTLSVGLRFDDHPSLFSLYYNRRPYSYAIPLVEGKCHNCDVDMDGRADIISLLTEEEKGRISSLSIAVNSSSGSVNTGIESLESYYIYAGPGRNYLLINAHTENSYGYISVYRLERGGPGLVGMLYDTSLHAAAITAECPGIPLLTKPEKLLLGTKIELLGTLTGVKDYSIGSEGMPRSSDEYYRVYADTTLTVKTPFATAAIDPLTGRGLNTAAKVESGTRMYYLRSDGASFVDMMSQDGVCCRMYVSGKGSAQTVNGMTVSDCFDGVIYK